MINLAYPKPRKTFGLLRGKLKERERPWQKKLWVFLVVFIFASGLGATWYFLKIRGKTDFSGQAVKIKITAPSEVIAGSAYEYFIEYANIEDIALKKAKLTVYFPPGFHLVDSLPSPEESKGGEEANVAERIQGESSSRTWDLGDLAAKSKDTIKLKGIILGEMDTSRLLRVNLVYEPENFQSNFGSEEKVEISVEKPAIDFSLEMPEKVGKDKEFNLAVKYKNATSEDLENVRIILSYPRNFVFLDAEPQADKENRIWDFRLLRRREQGRLDIRGKITSAEASPYLFQADFGLIDQYQQFARQVGKGAEVFVLDPDLEITATVNQKEEIKANLGDELDFVITYDNVGNVTLENAQIIFKMETDLLDTSSVSVEGGHYDANQFIWDYSSDPTLARLKPQEKGNVKFRAKLLSVFPYSTPDKRNLEIKGKAYLESNKIEGVEGFGFQAESNDLSISINTELSLVSEARYHNFDYEVVGAGPLPPKVGEATTYRIYWIVTNTTNDAERVRVETSLPPAGRWENNFFVSLGSNIKYEPETRRVSWEIGRLQAFSGSIFPAAQAWFMVGVIPETGQVGQVLDLTEVTTLSGRDLFTEKEIQNEYPSLTTDLKNDFGALGKGRVAR